MRSPARRAAGTVTAIVAAAAVLLATALPALAAPPVNTFISSQPAVSTTGTTATFTFSASRNPATFVCRLDARPAAACTSPVTYSALTPGLHTFSVTASSGGSVDPSPATYSWTVDQTAPAAPTGLAAAAPTPTSVRLTWIAATDNVGVTGYDVVRGGVTIATVGAVTSWTDTAVTAATPYSYALVARDRAGNVSGISAPAAVTTPAAAPAPDTVIDTTPATYTTSNRATFTFHSTVVGATFACSRDGAAFTACSSPVSYARIAAGTHSFAVRSTANGVTDPTPATASWNIDLTAPAAPASLSGTASSTAVTLSWPAATDNYVVASYDVLRDRTVVATVGAGVLTWTDSTVALGGLYAYSVRARDGAGNVSAVSSTRSYRVAAPYAGQLTRAPYLTDLVERHVAINFATDRSQTSASIRYGVVSGTTCTPTVVVPATSRALTVGASAQYQWTAQVDLPASGAYCYRVYLGSTDLLGANPSPWFTSQNVFGSTTPFSFAVVGDWGVTDANGVNEDQTNVIAQIAKSGARFLVTVGDNGYPNGNQADYGDLQQTATSKIFGPRFWNVASASTPIFPAVGNHGLAGVTHATLTTWTQDRAVAASGGRYANDLYRSINGSAEANYASAWYAFNAGNARFYVLDSAWGDTNAGNATPYANDALAHFAPGTPQYEWLVNDLANHPTQLKFAFSHYPFYSDSSEGSDTFLTGASNLEGVLGANGVQMVFNGHAHNYQRNTPSAPGMPVTYVTGGGGATLGPVGPCLLPNNAYAVGWSNSSQKGSACGAAIAPTSAAQVYHFLRISVSGTSVTVTPTDSTGATFDVRTYTFDVPPDTYVDSAPPVGTTSSSATFAFHSSGAGATFQCTRDGVTSPCTSPVTYAGLSEGTHTFSVVSTSGGRVDTTPARRTWTVDATAPGDPGAVTAAATGPFAVDLAWGAAADNTGVTAYEVYRDGGLVATVPGTATSYTDTAVVGSTTYGYQVRARDIAGNLSGFAASAPVTTTAAPAPVFADGFEGGTLARWTTTGGGLAVQSTDVHGGSFAAAGASGAYAKRTLAGTYDDAYARVWFSIRSASDQVNLLRLRDAGGSSLGYVFVSDSGALGYRNDATATSTLSEVLPTPGWHALELRRSLPTTPGGLGTVQVWLDNALVPGLSLGVDVGAAPVGQFQIGEVQSGLVLDVAYDDAAFGSTRLGPVADSTAPTAPVVTATATDAFSVDLAWTASSDDVGVAGYTVSRGGTVVASLPGDATSWADSSALPSTTYEYAVVATDTSGNASAAATTSITTPSAAQPVFADGFESGLGRWTASSGLVLQSALVHGGSTAARAAGTANARLTLVDQYADAYARTWFDVESLTNQMTLLRLRDSAGISLGYVYLSPTGKLGYRNEATATSVLSSITPDAGWHSVEVRRLAGASGAVQVWLDDVLVDDLTLTGVDTGAAPSGQVQVGDTQAGLVYDVVLDDVAFSGTRIGSAADSSGPSLPAATAAATSAFSVDVAWTASTDVSGLAAYEVRRDGVLVATTTPGTTGWTDTSVLASTSYDYAVRAIDTVGNASDWSAAATATTPAADTPVFADGFESGTFAAWSSSSVNIAPTAAPVYAGSWAARASTTAGASNVRRTLPGSYADAYARVRFNVTSQTSQTTLIRLRDTAAGSVGFLYLTAAGNLTFTGGPTGATVTLPSTVAPSRGSWHTAELHVVVAGASSQVQVWLDGVPVAALSAPINLGSAGPVTVLQVGESATTGTWDVSYDDAAFSTSRVGLG